jgi:hypothetical protein
MPRQLVLLGRFYVNPSSLRDHEYRRGEDGSVLLVLEFQGGVRMEVSGAAIDGVARSLALPGSPVAGPVEGTTVSGSIWCYGDPDLPERDQPTD